MNTCSQATGLKRCAHIWSYSADKIGKYMALSKSEFISTPVKEWQCFLFPLCADVLRSQFQAVKAPRKCYNGISLFACW